MADLLNIKEVAKKFKVTERTINNWVKNKGLPSIVIGVNSRRFDLVEIDGWAKKGKFNTPSNHEVGDGGRG